MPKTTRSSSSAMLSNISNCSVSQLIRLPAKVLRLHLSSHHLIISGTKAVMAKRLHNALHMNSPDTLPMCLHQPTLLHHSLNTAAAHSPTTAPLHF